MSKNEISIQQVKLFIALLDSRPEWRSSRYLAEAAGLNERTVRAHLRKLTVQRVVEVMEAFPGYRYRIIGDVRKRNTGYVHRLQAVRSMFLL
jgi:predicted ArsR family transcriptional regulator